MDFLREVEKKLDLPQAEKSQVMRELRSHYEEVKSELMDSGMDADTADQETALRLGDPGDVASRMQAVHCRVTWKTAWLTALGAAIGMLLPAISWPIAQLKATIHPGDWTSSNQEYWMACLVSLLVFACIFLAGSMRELVRGRRPMWLATWLAAGIHCLVAIPRLWELKHTLAGEVTVYSLLGTLIMTVLALWAFRYSPKWSSAIIIAFLFFASTIFLRRNLISDIHPNAYLWLFIAWPAYGLLTMSVALGLFGRRPYGNPAQASLFLFAYSISLQWLPGHTSLWIISTVILLFTSVIVISVISYARKAMWRQKLTSLAIGILVIGLINTILNIMYYITLKIPSTWYASLISVGIPNLITLAWVVFVPSLLERRRQVNRPEIVC